MRAGGEQRERIVGGLGFRLRLYSRHGVRAQEIAAIVACSIVTNWCGCLSVLGVMLIGGLAAVGFVDDYKKIRYGSSKGLSARAKYFWLSVAGFATAFAIYGTAQTPVETQLIVPLFKDIAIPLGWLFIPWVYLVIVGSSSISKPF